MMTAERLDVALRVLNLAIRDLEAANISGADPQALVAAQVVAMRFMSNAMTAHLMLLYERNQ